MRISPLTMVFPGVAWAIFAAAVAWPTVALVGYCLTDGGPPEGGFTFEPRVIGLLWRSVWMSSAATAAALAISLPAAYAVGRLGGVTRSPLVAVLLMTSLICPPMVYTFGWERLLPTSIDPHVRCIGVWALWGWPIPAMLIGTGWARAARRPFEAALLVSSPAAAFVRVVVPVLYRYALLGGLILFVLFFSDYGVPHACGLGLRVYATELLGWATGSVRIIDTVLPSLPAVAVIGSALAVALAVWRQCTMGVGHGCDSSGNHDKSTLLILLAFALFTVSWLLPVGVLVAKLSSTATFVEAFEVYGRDLAWSLAVAGTSGLLVVWMGIGVAAARRMGKAALIWTLALGAFPGALVGKALVVAYNHEDLAFIFDDWPIVALTYTSRFAWIGVVLGLLTTGNRQSRLVEQAGTDGAAHADILTRIHLPMYGPTWLCAVGVVASLSIADVAASALVRVPGATPIAHIIIEKFHRFEDGMLISLSLWLVFVSLAAAGFMLIALARWRKYSRWPTR